MSQRESKGIWQSRKRRYEAYMKIKLHQNKHPNHPTTHTSHLLMFSYKQQKRILVKFNVDEAVKFISKPGEN
jgi:hypothetical protein